MQDRLRRDAQTIIDETLRAALPDAAVERALCGRTFPGRVFMVAIGKAAWQMANTAYKVLSGNICDGIVITKHGHAKGKIGALRIREGGHPVPEAANFEATREALEITAGLCAQDTVLFLVSGGGSALFESPVISEQELTDVTGQLLASGADIVEMNTVRKRLSHVKGGRFALHCAPAQVLSIILSDIVGDPLDMIASGPAYPDSSTSQEALAVCTRYAIRLSDAAAEALAHETPKKLDNVETVVTGSVRHLCESAESTARRLGYQTVLLTDSMNCIAREAGRFLGAIGRTHASPPEPLAYIAGGETVVKLSGKGKGGRNQEIALAGAAELAGVPDCALFSVGSDGTDGPTDAAGGYVNGDTAKRLAEKGVSIAGVLLQNDAYPALQAVDGLIITGPTGTNVNDFSVLLLR